MLSLSSKGDYKGTMKWLERLESPDLFTSLEQYGQSGVNALAQATPTESGLTANSWGYTITTKNGFPTVTWYNTNTNGGAMIAILLQYGHGTGTGGYVSGRDYINPAIQPIFDRIADDVWKKVRAR